MNEGCRERARRHRSSAHCVSSESSLPCLPRSPTSKSALAFELDVFPGIGVAGCDCRREYVLPSFGGDPRTDRVDEGVAEDRDEVIILQDLALDLFGERLAFDRLVGGQIFVELGVEFAYANPVGG